MYISKSQIHEISYVILQTWLDEGIIEQLLREIFDGYKEGYDEGLDKARSTYIENCLKSNMPVPEVSAVLNVSKEYVLQVKNTLPESPGPSRNFFPSR